MYFVPVHEIYQHLRIFLVLLHLHCVGENHVQVEHKVLDLEKKDQYCEKMQMGTEIKMTNSDIKSPPVISQSTIF